MRVTKAKVLNSIVSVKIIDESLEIEVLVEMSKGEEPKLAFVVDPEDKISPLDLLTDEEVLLVYDIALDEAKTILGV